MVVESSLFFGYKQAKKHWQLPFSFFFFSYFQQNCIEFWKLKNKKEKKNYLLIVAE